MYIIFIFWLIYIIYSSIAQSVEHAAVNRSVVGSSPTGGVFLFPVNVKFMGFFYA